MKGFTYLDAGDNVVMVGACNAHAIDPVSGAVVFTAQTPKTIRGQAGMCVVHIRIVPAGAWQVDSIAAVE